MRPFILLILLLSSIVAHAEVVVVVAKSSSLKNLDPQSIANIFLARTKQFPNGEKATPVEIKRGDMRSGFYQTISGKTPMQLKAYWTTLVFTGKGKPPKGLDNPQEIEKRLLQQPGTIAYLNANDVTDNMKVVYRFE
ncbi:phosphate ABC transporter substrate-binding protein [Neptunicella sp. SCSIO 80796]|uniref:phosphate ABC transporter substrate-binding protein n=1 Tax=Neptunicella plasticusilytica TaxID=3117012 RepID=UPI003A4DDF93